MFITAPKLRLEYVCSVGSILQMGHGKPSSAHQKSGNCISFGKREKLGMFNLNKRDGESKLSLSYLPHQHVNTELLLCYMARGRR